MKNLLYRILINQQSILMALRVLVQQTNSPVAIHTTHSLNRAFEDTEIILEK